MPGRRYAFPTLESHPKGMVVFYRVATSLLKGAGSLAQAARECGLATSTLDDELDTLEGHGEHELLVAVRRRGHRRVRTTQLTPDGMRLYESLHPDLGMLIERSREASPKGHVATIRVAAHQAVVQHVLLPEIAKLAARASEAFRNSRLVLLSRPSEAIVSEVRDWRIDWGIVSGDLGEFRSRFGEPSKIGVSYETCLRFPTVLFLPPDCTRAGVAINPRRLTLGDVACGPLVLVRPYARFRQRLDERFAARGLPNPNVRLELDSGAAVISAVNENIGMAIVHEVTVPPDLRADRKRVIRLPSDWFGDNELGVIRATRRPVAAAASELLAAVLPPMR